MALSQGRAAEILALLSPLVLANPLARQIDGAEAAASLSWKPLRGMMLAALVAVLVAGTLAFASIHRYAPYTGNSPVQAVAELKKLRREVAELRRANAILKTASAFFAAELDRPAH